MVAAFLPIAVLPDCKEEPKRLGLGSDLQRSMEEEREGRERFPKTEVDAVFVVVVEAVVEVEVAVVVVFVEWAVVAFG